VTAGETLSLDVEGLACQRGGRLLFEQMSFGASAGSLVTVRGANGSGKTSLLRLLVGFGIPVAGRISWRGLRAGAVGWLGHVDALKSDFSPRENLAFHQAFHAASGDIDRALTAAGLDQHADVPVRTLSAGQRRRTALARFALLDLPVWILDEPLTALDDSGQQWVTDLIAAHCRSGGMVVLTSHQALVGLQPQVELTL
jgi:heme exporter protein A